MRRIWRIFRHIFVLARIVGTRLFTNVFVVYFCCVGGRRGSTKRAKQTPIFVQSAAWRRRILDQFIAGALLGAEMDFADYTQILCFDSGRVLLQQRTVRI